MSDKMYIYRRSKKEYIYLIKSLVLFACSLCVNLRDYKTNKDFIIYNKIESFSERNDIDYLVCSELLQFVKENIKEV